MTLSIVFLLLALGLNAVANVLLKIGSQSVTFQNLTLDKLVDMWPVFLGLTCFGFNVIFYALALSKIPLSIAYPVMAVGGITIITGSAYFILGESITSKQIIGYLLLAIGLTLVVQPSS